jgi:hypothetical protein
MIRFKLTAFFLLFFLKGYSQDSIAKVNNNEVWGQRINIGISAGYPHIPFVNLGMKFYDKIYIELFFEMDETEKYSSFFDLGYQSNNLFNNDIKSQLGISLLQVANKDFTDKINDFGINMKFSKPFASWAGIFISGHIGYPDSRTDFKNLINGNVGIEFYFRRIPFLIY